MPFVIFWTSCQFPERLNDTVSNPVMQKLGLFGGAQPDGMYNVQEEQDVSVCPTETLFCVGQFSLTACVAFKIRP